jgi:hypothetical protein
MQPVGQRSAFRCMSQSGCSWPHRGPSRPGQRQAGRQAGGRAAGRHLVAGRACGGAWCRPPGRTPPPPAGRRLTAGCWLRHAALCWAAGGQRREPGRAAPAGLLPPEAGQGRWLTLKNGRPQVSRVSSSPSAGTALMCRPLLISPAARRSSPVTCAARRGGAGWDGWPGPAAACASVHRARHLEGVEEFLHAVAVLLVLRRGRFTAGLGAGRAKGRAQSVAAGADLDPAAAQGLQQRELLLREGLLCPLLCLALGRPAPPPAREPAGCAQASQPRQRRRRRPQARGAVHIAVHDARRGGANATRVA